MTASQAGPGREGQAGTADVAGVLARVAGEHQTTVSVMGGWSAKHGRDSDKRYGWSCRCGEHSPEQFKVYLTIKEADTGRFAHVAAEQAAALAPLLAQRDTQQRAEAWDDGHDCCTYPICRDNPHTTPGASS